MKAPRRLRRESASLEAVKKIIGDLSDRDRTLVGMQLVPEP